MATNFVKNGTTTEFVASTAVTSGAVVVIGSIFGLSLDDVASGETGVAQIVGVWEVPKVTGTAITKGASLDYDVSTKKFAVLATPAAGDLVGCAVCDVGAASADTTVTVIINMSGAKVA